MKKLILAIVLSPLFLLATTNSIRAGSCTPLFPGNPCSTTTCYAKSSYYCCSSPADCTSLGGLSSNAACVNTTNPEFHSLRPYPYSPCQVTTANYATFCGNKLTLQDTITESYPGGGGCTTTNGVTTNGVVTCSYNVSVNKPISINLSGANLPFMGNTENVPNSTTPTGSPPPLSNADKVNGYVSWYLNGVMNRAEGGTSENTDYNTVNLSGPINKLLPGAILDAQRIKSISNVAANTNHNQIVVCGKNQLGIIGDIFNIGSVTPVNCYSGNGSPAKGSTALDIAEGYSYFRLDSWNGSLSIANLLSNSIIKAAVESLKILYPFVPAGGIEKSLGNHWNSRKPPLPWKNDPFASPTRPMTSLEYQKYYSEWTGKTCVIIPIVNILICFNNILIPNRYADLYPYIPLSSIEDLEGNVKVDSVAGDTINGTITVTNVSFSGQTPATLFFAHVEESSELGTLLQSTYVPQGQKKIGTPTETSNEVTCNPVEVRSNKGDSLTSGSSIISGNLSYNTSFTCNFKPTTFTIDPNCMSECLQNAPDPSVCRAECQVVPLIQTCSKTINITLSTEVNSPKLDDVWSQLVAGPMAVVKRLFPKLGSQLGTLEDIPGSTSITYSGAVNSNATLNIPHVGGIDEYFLNGIQTLLRPKGFGEPISFGPKTTGAGPGGKINCDQKVPETAVNGLDKTQANNVAKGWYQGSLGKPYFTECNNDVIKRAKNKGINTIFALAIWIHESGASNYTAVNYPVQDFGINSEALAPSNDFSQQLNAFLNLPGAYYATCNKKDMNTFISMYWLGHCAPLNPDEVNRVSIYTDELKFVYSVIAPGATLPNYPN